MVWLDFDFILTLLVGFVVEGKLRRSDYCRGELVYLSWSTFLTYGSEQNVCACKIMNNA